MRGKKGKKKIDRSFNPLTECCKHCKKGNPCSCTGCIQGECSFCPCGRARIKVLEARRKAVEEMFLS